MLQDDKVLTFTFYGGDSGNIGVMLKENGIYKATGYLTRNCAYEPPESNTWHLIVRSQVPLSPDKRIDTGESERDAALLFAINNFPGLWSAGA